MTALLLQTGAALAFVIVLIAGAAFAYRKRKPAGAGPLGLVAYQAFGPRRGVAAVRVGREILVLGVTNADLKLFRVVPAADFETGVEAAVADKVARLRKMGEEL